MIFPLGLLFQVGDMHRNHVLFSIFSIRHDLANTSESLQVGDIFLKNYKQVLAATLAF